MSVFKAYDIRGVYGDNLTDKTSYLAGFYLSKYLNEDVLMIAHDKRISYEEVTKFFIKGIIDAGTSIEYLGLSSTPNFYYSISRNPESSGVIVTASHNPKEFNGFKIMYKGKSFDSRNGLKEVEKLFEEDKYNMEESFSEVYNELKGKTLLSFLMENEISYSSTLEEYTSFLSDFYHNVISEEEENELEKIKFAVDLSSGVSSLAISKLLEDTSLNYKLINHLIDGNFPSHSPEPSKAKQFIKNQENDVDFTAVFDGDGDRIVYFDENNEFIIPDYIIARYIDFFSKDHKEFACDLRISKSVTELAEEKKLNLHKMRVGRAFYTSFMEEQDCFFGAELSGHFFFRSFNYLDNPDIALIYMLKIVANELLQDKENFKFSKMVERYERYYKTEEINQEVNNPDEVIEKLKQIFSDHIISQLDGITVEMRDHWFNVRKSNTENIIRIILEGDNEEIVQKSLEDIKSLIET